MKGTNSRLSLTLALIAAIGTFICLLLAGINLVVTLGVTVGLFALFYGVFRLVIFLVVFKDLENVYHTIDIAKKTSSGYNAYPENFTISHINKAFSALVKEKTSEIDKLKEIERFRQDFLGNVAHELRTPIFSIQGYLDALEGDDIQDKKLRKRFIKKAAKNADNLSNIIEDLTTISSIETQQIQLSPSDFAFDALIEDVVDKLEIVANQKNITFEVAGSKNVMVRADRLKMEQVLINLISNSIKYGTEGGKTIISLFELTDDVRIEIADNGIGISNEDLPRIFERFYRVDKSRTRQHGGSTGLGLAIVKHFIEAHNQEITARSSLGAGTTFSFRLPKVKSN